MKKIIYLLSLWATFSFAQQKPNIIFIEVDDLTAKYLGCFGAKFAKTPTIDKLASTGVVFENAVCQGTQCGPSRNSVITGQYPHNLGFYENKQPFVINQGTWVLPKALQNLGYSTFWVGKCHIKPDKGAYKNASNKIEQMQLSMKNQMGFDFVYESLGRTLALRNGKKMLKNGTEWPKGDDAYGDFLYEQGKIKTFVQEGGDVPSTLDPDKEYMDGRFTTVALEQLANYKETKPFFLWLNFSCPHGPYDVPQKYHDMFKGAELPKPIPYADPFMPAELRKDISKFSAEKTMKERVAYAASIAYVDDQVKRVVDFINKSKFAENTMIVFFSDHGVMTGDYGLEHKRTLYNEVINPSLIINYPKGIVPRRITTPVELIDLCKTSLDFAGAKDLKQCPQGSSLRPLLENNDKNYLDGNYAFSEVEGFISVYDGKYKYIEGNGYSILFDYSKNPNENQNFASSNPKQVAIMKAQIQKWIAETGKIQPVGITQPKKMEKKGKGKNVGGEDNHDED